jgi:hypothetical protein
MAQTRAVFHSEADFQHAFAWELHRTAPEWDIRLEVPVRMPLGSIHLDLLARSRSGEVAIELKYKTTALSVDWHGEEFALMNHAAQDLGRYDFFKDLNRVEAFAQSGLNRGGYAIFLTNDSAYWKAPASLEHGYAGFAMNDGRRISGDLCWGERASEGTRRGRLDDIAICGRYCLEWAPYSSLPVKSYSKFRYLCVRAVAA